jgi:serine protease Do
VVIADVDPSGAAASAGLREGDVIQQVNGKSVQTAEEVRSALNATADKPAVLLIARGNATIFVPLRGVNVTGRHLTSFRSACAKT